MPSREEHAADVEAMDVGRQYSADKENAVDQAIGAEVVEKSHSKGRTENVEKCYADAIAECAKHRCCSLVLMVVC